MVAIPIELADEFSSLVRQMNHVVDREMRRQYHGFSPTDAFRPPVNLYETLTAFVLCADLSGMDAHDIEVSLEKEFVIIRGRRQSPIPPDGSPAVAVHLMEIDHGTFCRSIEIPATVRHEGIAANYHDGLLWVTLPKLLPDARE